MHDRAFIRDLNAVEHALLQGQDDTLLQSGYHAFIPDFLQTGLHLARKHVRANPSFFDFGSGTGKMLAVARREGYSAYGIDINPDLAKHTDTLMATLEAQGHVDKTTTYRYAVGSYFPQAYRQLRKQGHAQALKYEAQEETFGNPGATLCIAADPYAELGKQLSNFDVLYAYTWSSQLPAILEMYSRYAHQDALLLYHTAKPHFSLPELHREFKLATLEPNLEDAGQCLTFVAKRKRVLAPMKTAA
jgi:SAM-dependent methyltransferase